MAQKAIRLQWDNLPNLLVKEDGSPVKIFPMIDTSGSMYSGYTGTKFTPIILATSLGMYIAQRNKAFPNVFITFNSKPKFCNIKFGKITPLREIYHEVIKASWGYNTNFEAAYTMLLELAQKAKVSQDDMPEYILCLSDMEFDPNDNGVSARKDIKEKYKDAGYKVPKIIFWNLNGNSSNTSPVKPDSNKNCYVSGFSPNILKAILSDSLGKFTPVNVMLEAIMKEKYDVFN